MQETKEFILTSFEEYLEAGIEIYDFVSDPVFPE